MSFWTALRGGTSGKADAFQHGVEARAAGQRLSDNPYCLCSEGHREWSAGWRATLDLDEDDDVGSFRERSERDTAN